MVASEIWFVLGLLPGDPVEQGIGGVRREGQRVAARGEAEREDIVLEAPLAQLGGLDLEPPRGGQASGADVRGVDPKSGEYPLARAAWNFRPEVLEYLYSKGAVREPGSKSLLVPDRPPKFDAETDERYARTLRVLVAHGENIDEPSSWGPPVRYAAEGNATNAMAVAVELGAAVDPRAGAHPPARSSAE